MHQLVHVTQQGLLLVLIVSALPVMTSLLVGLVISILQATTQIQEQTLSFAPKLLAVMGVLAIAGSWIGHQIWAFAFHVFDRFPAIIAR
jgi:flagellar biosynthesis protein FliQ